MKDALIGGRVVVRIASGRGDGDFVEVIGTLLGRGRFDSVPYIFRQTPDHAARVRLDDGSVLSAPVDALVRRAEQ